MKKLLSIMGMVGLMSFCAPRLQAQFTNEEFVDGIFVENATGAKRPVPLPVIREADVMWKKTIWREIDFNQKINQGFYHPITAHENWQNLITILINGLKESSLTAYKDELSGTGEIKDLYKFKDIEEKYKKEGKQAVFNEHGEDTGDSITIEKGLKDMTQDITRCRIKEVWYFDKQRSQLLVRILAICPVIMTDINGVKTPEPMFWIPYNDATRELLAQKPYYNINNPAAKLSYDEVFMKRYFDSYIYREENIYDRNINQYAKGVDALLESERIKQEIANFEQFLWEY